jgi:uncharacterized membrane protein (UPF0182 family)
MARPRPVRAIVVAIVLFLLLGILPATAGSLTDWFWFQEIGYQVVFSKMIAAQAVLFCLTFAIAFAFLYLNFNTARGGTSVAPVLYRINPGLPPVDISSGVRRVPIIVAAVAALMFGFVGSSEAMGVLQFLNRVPFAATDPVFGRDIGWFVFVLPQVSVWLGVLRSLIVLSVIGSALLYVFRGMVHVAPRVSIEDPAARHLGILAAVFFVTSALQIWFVRIPSLVYSTTGPLIGASYTDLHARYPAMHLVAVAAILTAATILYGMMRRKLAFYSVTAIVSYLVFSVVVGGLFPAAMQRFIVAPTELTRESPQLQQYITATRRAWDLDSVETRDLNGVGSLTLDDIRSNAATIQNVRLWDREPLLQTFGQLQEIRTYYDFVNVDDDRYMVDGRYRQVMLAPRELNSASLPTRSFINQHLTFTHGMGLTLGPVNEVTNEGLPVLFVKDLPPSSSVSLKVTRPQIYFGELTDEHVFVNTRQPEFDYPSGDANISTRYTGTGGVPIGNVLKRALFAIRFGALNVLLSGDIRSDSRVMFDREIKGRVAKAMPFLTLDDDPYIVIAEDGKLKWIVDGYTSTSRYPYSFRTENGKTYMRNSVKVVVDAYDGSLDSYVADADDPLIKMYAKVFPGIFRPLSAMPLTLRAHMRYPHDLFRVQSTLYTVFHMSNPTTFYNREDQWQLPSLDNQRESSDRFTRHLIMRLPEEKSEEYIYMAPFTPRGKDNLAAWMVARNDGDHYGKLRVYRFPKQSLIYGPKQIMSRINQDTEISRQLTLWDQRGSEVLRGELLVIPINEALLYVQPIYLRAENGKIPELKRVVVAFQNRVVMDETLDIALARVFGGDAGVPVQAKPDSSPAMTAPQAVPDASPLLQQARDHYDRAIAAQKAGDWATYGEEIRRLGDVLRQLNK